MWVVVAAACSESASPATDAPIAEDAAMWTTLFDGTLGPAWRMSTITNQPGRDDPGAFVVADGALVPRLGNDLGLLWHTTPTPPSFELALEFSQQELASNSGVFVRFPDLDSKGYDNTAFVAADFGFEIQIDGLGAPDGAPHHTTGAIYNQLDQELSLVPARPPGEWSEFVISVVDQTYTVHLDGAQTTRFVNRDASRGLPSPAFIGVQIHPGDGNVRFRNIRIRAL